MCGREGESKRWEHQFNFRFSSQHPHPFSFFLSFRPKDEKIGPSIAIALLAIQWAERESTKKSLLIHASYASWEAGYNLWDDSFSKQEMGNNFLLPCVCGSQEGFSYGFWTTINSSLQGTRWIQSSLPPSLPPLSLSTSAIFFFSLVSLIIFSSMKRHDAHHCCHFDQFFN